MVVDEPASEFPSCGDFPPRGFLIAAQAEQTPASAISPTGTEDGDDGALGFSKPKPTVGLCRPGPVCLDGVSGRKRGDQKRRRALCSSCRDLGSILMRCPAWYLPRPFKSHFAYLDGLKQARGSRGRRMGNERH